MSSVQNGWPLAKRGPGGYRTPSGSAVPGPSSGYGVDLEAVEMAETDMQEPRYLREAPSPKRPPAVENRGRFPGPFWAP